ncbi:MAG TPA: DUF2490 domain-containing protein [Bacteroidales bacterium]|nr:DUF2490 domain-containing protein [Bacteroidales bacterium]HPT01590.1 DUF2490 domain-containing protein [Bacteroidales bacterium]
MNNRFALLLILFLPFIPGYLSAQTNDAQLWMGVNLEKKLTPEFSLYFAEELRMNENITEAGTIFSDLGLGYSITPGLKVSANYRFISKRRIDDSYSMRHRYYFDLSYRHKFMPLILSVRARYQSQYTDILSSEDGKIPENYERTRLKLGFDTGKAFEPYLTTEAFIPVGKQYDSPVIDCMRYTAGMEYKFYNRHSIDAWYMIQHEMNVPDPETDFVIGLGYSFVF